MSEKRSPGAAEPRTRVFRWGKILASFFAAHSAVQLLQLVAGLLLVNFLPLQEFALYTLATSVLAFAVFLSDLGATSSLAHFYREERVAGRDPARYVAAVRTLRRLALPGVAAVATIALVLLARHERFAAVSLVLAGIAMLSALAAQVECGIRLTEERLEGRYSSTYRAEVVAAFARLIGTAALIVAGWLYGWLALAIGAAATAAVIWMLPSRSAPPPGAELRAERRQVVRYLLPTLPSALYFSIQGPLVVFLAATFGSSANVAEVGALGRLGLIVGALSSLTGVVLVPKLAGVTDDRLWRRRYLQFAGLLALLALPLLALAQLAPQLLLALLGATYDHLGTELLWVVATACLGLLDGYLVGVNNARSWTRLQAPAVLLLLLAQVWLVWRLPLATTWGVVIFGFASRCVSTASQLVIGLVGLARPAAVVWRTR